MESQAKRKRLACKADQADEKSEKHDDRIATGDQFGSLIAQIVTILRLREAQKMVKPNSKNLTADSLPHALLDAVSSKHPIRTQIPL